MTSANPAGSRARLANMYDPGVQERSHVVQENLKQTIRHPGRVLKLRSSSTRKGVARTLRRHWTMNHIQPPDRGWQVTGQPGVKSRTFASYDEYKETQMSKLNGIYLGVYDTEFHDVLKERLANLALDLQGKPVLCLAARIGTEVRAFHSTGAFAVGVDLNPGENNPYVLTGDFHAIQFPDRSAAYVYCNSLDHAFDLDRLVAEISRVLSRPGFAIIEAMDGSTEFGRWEATSWDDVNDLVRVFTRAGFAERSRKAFDYPWPGYTFIFAAPEHVALEHTTS